MLAMAEETWECSLLPPARSFASRSSRSCSGLLKRVPSDLKDPSLTKSAESKCRSLMTEEIGSKAQLVSLEMRDFKCFKEKIVHFKANDCTCIVGPNSSGKSSIVDAIKFIVLHPDVKQPRSLVRRCHPAVSKCCIVAIFEAGEGGKVKLQREVHLESQTEHKVTFAIQLNEDAIEELSESRYASCVERILGRRDDNVFLGQFGFMRDYNVTSLLKQLPQALEQWTSKNASGPPRLKRSKSSNLNSSLADSLSSNRTNAEAWVSRRIDEIYRELSREPLDEKFETWSDGGQACLRCLQDGSFTIFVSKRRGLAALGRGSPLETLSDGDHDLCAFALFLTMSRLQTAGLNDTFPDFVILDDPDSRLDKRAACCLFRLLSGPLRPKQCLITSLNNHRAFTDDSASVTLPELIYERDSTLTSMEEEKGQSIYGDYPALVAVARQ